MSASAGLETEPSRAEGLAAAPRPLRVLMVAATPYFADRGCHVRIQGEARALERRGVEVTIATYGLGRDVPGGHIVRAAGLPGYRRLDAAPTWGKLALDLLLLGRSFRLARALRPDLIHAHTQEGGLIGLLAGRILGIPVLVDLQSRRVAEELEDYGASREGGLLWRIASRFDRAIPRAASAVVASSEAIAAFVRAEARPSGPVVVLGDAIDRPPAPPVPDLALARALGLDPVRPVVVYMGLLTEAQGVDLLLAAAARLGARGHPAQFLLFGFPAEELWRLRARALGLEGSVLFPGRIPHARHLDHLALGRLAVSAKRSTAEGNGKLLSYMAAGLATVALDTPVSRAILGPEGIYVPDDPEALAAAIEAALADPADLERRGRALFERAGREASWEARADLLLELYRSLKRRS